MRTLTLILIAVIVFMSCSCSRKQEVILSQEEVSCEVVEHKKWEVGMVVPKNNLAFSTYNPAMSTTTMWIIMEDDGPSYEYSTKIKGTDTDFSYGTGRSKVFYAARNMSSPKDCKTLFEYSVFQKSGGMPFWKRCLTRVTLGGEGLYLDNLCEIFNTQKEMKLKAR